MTSLKDYPEIISATSQAKDGNMSFLQGKYKEILDNRKRYLSLFDRSLGNVVAMSAAHGNQVIKIGEKDLGRGAYTIENAPIADALITNRPGIVLLLLTADCLPISLYDPTNKVIGLIHAGWKGLELNVINNTINKMETIFHTNPEELVAMIGPSIGPCCYKGFTDLKQQDDPKWQPYIFKDNNGLGLDLWSFAQKQLQDKGLLSQSIHNSKICTYHNNNYFSHRRFDSEKLENDSRVATILRLRR